MRFICVNKVILFGDSQVEQSSNQVDGFNIAPALQHEYWSKLQVISHGYGGYNSEHGRHIIEPILRAETSEGGGTSGSKVKLLTICFGTNDAADPVHNTLSQSVTVDRYTQNLVFMVNTAMTYGIEAELVVGPAPVNELAAEAPSDRFTLRARQYSQAAAEVAGQLRPAVSLSSIYGTASWKLQGGPMISLSLEEEFPFRSQ
jgi:isoamyl acetate esterase